MILGRKLKNPRLILSEDFFFFCLHPSISNNFFVRPSKFFGWCAYIGQGLRLFRYGNLILDKLPKL